MLHEVAMSKLAEAPDSYSTQNYMEMALESFREAFDKTDFKDRREEREYRLEESYLLSNLAIARALLSVTEKLENVAWGLRDRQEA